MEYDFDNIVNRRGTDSVKWNEDVIESICSNRHADAFWVADMDFETAPSIKETAKKVADLALFGYPMENPITSIFSSWCEKRHDWKIDESKTAFVSGLLHGIALAIDLFTKEGDKLLIPSPTYRPFMEISKDNNRIMLDLPLRKRGDGTFYLDRKDFKTSLNEAALVLFCSPHNPSGLVFSHDDLIFILTEAKKQNKIVISDEIHADLTLPPHRHLPFAMVSEKAKNNSVTFMAPSKAFNMPGVAASHTVIYNDGLRSRFETYLEAGELNAGHVFAFPAVEAAYSNGTEWLDRCIEYIQGNIDYVDSFLKENTPKIKAVRPMASYLIWLDCRELGLNHEELNSFFADKAGLALNDGEMFGREGAGFMRMNVGTQRSVLERAMKQLAEAYMTL